MKAKFTLLQNKKRAVFAFKGGKGSGFHGHAGGIGGPGNPGGSQSNGRLGEVGGSSSGSKYTEDELVRMDIEKLDKMAFGFTSGIQRMDAKSLIVKYNDDLENAKYQMQHSGLSPKIWAGKFTFDEPIQVMYQKGKFIIQDGHHRYLAATILNKKINVDITIDDNPIPVILAKQ